MRLFLNKILFIFIIPIMLLTIIGLYIPPAPIAQSTHIYDLPDKIKMLDTVEGQRLILVGGSNLSFGLNSQLIKDSLDLNPINTAIHASFGLDYCLNLAAEYARGNDIFVVVPEYEQYYGNTHYGKAMLLPTVFTIAPRTKKHIKAPHWVHLSQFMPEFVIKKFNFLNYFKSAEGAQEDWYSKNSINSYGDTNLHWGEEKKNFKPYKKLADKINPRVIRQLLRFQEKVEKRGATVYISFPGYQDISYDRSAEQVEDIYATLLKHNFNLLGSPERYVMPDSIMFDTPYHLIKVGVDRRTQLMIEDLKASPALSSN